MIPITVLGHTYKSISAAHRELECDIPEITVRWRLKNGWDTAYAFFTDVVPPEDRRIYKQFRTTFNEVSD